MIEFVSPDFLVINLDKIADPGLMEELTDLDVKDIHFLAYHYFIGIFLHKYYVSYELIGLKYLDRTARYNPIKFILKWFCLLNFVNLTSPIILYEIIENQTLISRFYCFFYKMAEA